MPLNANGVTCVMPQVYNTGCGPKSKACCQKGTAPKKGSTLTQAQFTELCG